jgi:hypothetical protein
MPFADQGKSVTVKVTDRCTGCAEYDLDFVSSHLPLIASLLSFSFVSDVQSPSAFDILADPTIGRIHGMTWDWV